MRLNPWFYQKNGALNPAWAFLGMLLGMECFAVFMAFLQESTTVKIVCCSLLGVTINILVMASVSQSKAEIIAHAKSTGEIATGLSSSIINHEDRP